MLKDKDRIDTPIQIRLTLKQYNAVVMRARIKRVSMATVVRDALDLVLTDTCGRCSGTGKEPKKL